MTITTRCNGYLHTGVVIHLKTQQPPQEDVTAILVRLALQAKLLPHDEGRNHDSMPFQRLKCANNANVANLATAEHMAALAFLAALRSETCRNHQL